MANAAASGTKGLKLTKTPSAGTGGPSKAQRDWVSKLASIGGGGGPSGDSAAPASVEADVALPVGGKESTPAGRDVAASCRITVTNNTQQPLNLTDQGHERGDFMMFPPATLAPGANAQFVSIETPNAKDDGCKGFLVWQLGNPMAAVWRIEWDNPEGQKNTASSTLNPQGAGFSALEQVGQGEENVPINFTISGGPAPSTVPPGPGPGPVPEAKFEPPVEAVPKGGADGAKGGKEAAPAAPASSISGPVGKGGRNKSDDVKAIQTLLNQNGAKLAVDGLIGPQTIKAIGVFQKSNGLAVDGKVDPGGKTWSALTGGGSSGAAAPDAPTGSGASGAGGSAGGAGRSATKTSGKAPAGASTGGGASPGPNGTDIGAAAPDDAPAAPGKSKNKKSGVPDGEVEVGWGDKAIGIKKSKDGTTITIKEDRTLPLLAKNFMVWVIPCYIKGGVKAEIAGSITIGKKTGGGLQATAAGTLELGVGGTGGGITAGPYGAVQLAASNSCSVTYDEKDGLDVQPFTFSITGSGKVGIKVEIDDGPKADINQECFNWELFVVNVGRYSKGKFEFVDMRAGKDLQRLLSGLEAQGPKIEAFVEKYAPDAVKKAAEKGAKWAAESDEAGKIADEVDKGVKYIKDKTGVDVGAGIEEVVQSLIDEHGETSQEATDRVNKEMETFDASVDDFHAVIDASGLKGELKPFRKPEEYNAIVDVWQAETELTVKGKKAPGKWRGMVEALVKTARERKAQQKTQQKAAEQEKKKQEDQAVQAAVAAMEGARPAAQGPGNVLYNKLQKTPNAAANQILIKGQQAYFAAEAKRNEALAASGPAKAQKASEAKALYEQAQATFKSGLQQL